MEGFSRRPPHFISDLRLARLLNSATGSGVFTPWNVGQIPQDEIDAIHQWQALSEKQAGFAQQRLEREKTEA